jgi:hypothetical protein
VEFKGACRQQSKLTLVSNKLLVSN